MAKKSSKKTRPASEEKAPVQPDDSQELVVFAFRLTRAERDQIHQAAGAAKASKFARTLLVAAARNDEATLKTAVRAAQGEA